MELPPPPPSESSPKIPSPISPRKTSWSQILSDKPNESLSYSTDVEFIDGVAQASIPKEVLEHSQPLWSNFIVGYFIGDAPHIGKVHATVNRIWSSQDKNSRIDAQFLSPRTVLFRIADPQIRSRVLRRHFWHISDLPLVVQEWNPRTSHMKPDLTSMPIWVDFKDVPDHLYSEVGLKFLGNIIAVVLFLITLVASCNAAENATTQPLAPAILIFGDSTVDTGNNNYHPKANFKANHIPYGVDLPGKAASGRFSNGKLYCDIVASKLHIKELVPPFLQPNLSDAEIVTGVSFASAGSGYDDRTMLTTKAIPVSYQPTMFKNYITRLKGIVGEKKAMEIINGAIVIVSAGTNDFILNYYGVPTRRLEYPKISDYQNFVLKRLENFVKELYNLGCRKMTVGGLSPMGCLPIQMTSKFRSGVFRTCIERENKDALLYNEKLQKLLPAIEASLPGSKIVYTNVYDPMMDMIQNPTKYGFKETKKGCCGTGYLETGDLCNSHSKLCSNHSEYMFFDSIHPSLATYSHLVDSTYPTISKLLNA